MDPCLAEHGGEYQQKQYAHEASEGVDDVGG